MCDVIKHLIGGHQFSLRYGVAIGVAHQKQLRRQIGQPASPSVMQRERPFPIAAPLNSKQIQP
jgi:hypothetical protein